MVVFFTAIMSLVGCSEDNEEILSGSARLVIVPNINTQIYLPDGSVATDAPKIVAPSAEDLSFLLTKIDGSYSHLWDRLSSYPKNEPLRPGAYVAELFKTDNSGSAEEYSFYGKSEVTLIDGITSTLHIDCKLAVGFIRVRYSDNIKSIFESCKLIAHAEGSGYVELQEGINRVPVGKCFILAAVKLKTGEDIKFNLTQINGLKGSELWEFSLNAQQQDPASDPELTLRYGGGTVNYEVTKTINTDLITAQVPVLTPDGFSQDEVLGIVEGHTPDHKLGISISGGEAMTLIMSTTSPEMISPQWPSEIDLCHMTQMQSVQLAELGLDVSRSNGIPTYLDLTQVMKNISASTQKNSIAFNFIAAGLYGTLSDVATMNVSVTPAKVSIKKATPMLIGTNMSCLTVESNTPLNIEGVSIEAYNETTGEWMPAQVQQTKTSSADNITELTVKLPTITQNRIKLRLKYMSVEKDMVEITTVSPQYSISVDAFALLAVVRVEAATPELSQLITSLLNIYINGGPTQYVARYNDESYLVVGGLESSREYTIKTTVYNADAVNKQFTPEVRFSTEQMLQVPNGNFEKIEDGIKYKSLPSGGRYSQTIVDIYNQQNYANYDLSQPKGWANTNSKQFCTSASNHNTWYMQPGVYTTTEHIGEGAYSVTIRSTAWDLNGEKIPDYRQTSSPGIPYNKNIPHISQRAAGKLFLGEYHFDAARMQESYIEGVGFESRPSNLNGYYKFVPSLQNYGEKGLVEIEIIGLENGKETVIASSRYELTTAISYKAFSVPLTYYKSGVKATKLKIMFSSSNYEGSIAEETAQVTTSPDAATATSIGGILTIDELTFTY